MSAADGTPVAVGGPRPRALLVVLALNANRVVGVDAIVAAQYGDEPPADAAGAVQAHVSRLRKAVPDVSFDGTGYRLTIAEDDVDAPRFERLAGEGRRALAERNPELAADLLRRAQKSSGEGITGTIRQGLELVAAGRACKELRRLRGRVSFSIDLKKLREDRS